MCLYAFKFFGDLKVWGKFNSFDNLTIVLIKGRGIFCEGKEKYKSIMQFNIEREIQHAIYY